jgi:hypothetical protein
MGQKFRILLFLLGLAMAVALAWSHWERVDTEVVEKVQLAENERHGYVISPDFGLIKERLIESHRDHWKDYAKVERKARWELGGIVILFLIFSYFGVYALRKGRSLPK